MAKLTDSQLVILSAAGGRADGAVLPPPKSLKAKGGALTSVLKGLLKKGLVAETPAAPDATAWREAEDGRRMALVIAEAGLQAIGADDDEKAPVEAKAGRDRRASRNSAKGRQPKPAASPAAVRPGTKQALLIDLLQRKKGASIDEIVAATGWQPHSVRGAISGTLKKKLGLTVTSEKHDGRGRVYRVTGAS